ncbi:dUTP diphosphatase [Adlercreutzia equolifaciens]|uniref:dUTP diphosphatase n=1 Tax=Adlercreutzia equolifaciens TaxID=446660 RepID=UPI0023B1F9C9|nr:dUTP diphosphatase [Adlercreutzia equolifaciens]MDE8703184.1 dUTP diphosphatase [Adlercreutzia equolifaciens]
MLAVNVTLLDPAMPAPAYAHDGDAALDIRSTVDGVLQPGERRLVPCGFALELPEGYAALVLPRSGLAAKHGISVVNAPGLIDSGYRGEIKVCLINTDTDQAFSFSRGDRIAQLMIIPVPTVHFNLVDSLSISERGSAGFGSSGLQ